MGFFPKNMAQNSWNKAIFCLIFCTNLIFLCLKKNFGNAHLQHKTYFQYQYMLKASMVYITKRLIRHG